MTQIERNFGTKALRRDGVRCDTQGGRALFGGIRRCAKACEAARFISCKLQGKADCASAGNGEGPGQTANNDADWILPSV